jgi:hypothetical protein
MPYRIVFGRPAKIGSGAELLRWPAVEAGQGRASVPEDQNDSQDANYALAEAEAIAMDESDRIHIGGNPDLDRLRRHRYPTF